MGQFEALQLKITGLSMASLMLLIVADWASKKFESNGFSQGFLDLLKLAVHNTLVLRPCNRLL